jgi:hypothetical protein
VSSWSKAKSRPDAAAAQAAGHEPKPMLDVIRAKCLDCQAGSPGAVRKCVTQDCALWPYRMASNPFRTRAVPAAQRAALSARLKGQKT